MYDDIGVAIVFAIAAMMLKIYLTHREKMKGMTMTRQNLSTSDERLARMEQAMESIALEVERIGEGQRFVTKLMSERAQPMFGHVAVPAQPRQADTPH